MEINNFLLNLRDPAGIPFYAVVFQFLMVLTFALHIIAVNIVAGGLCVSVYEACRGTVYSRRLARALGRAATIMLSFAIVLGVAPLLFVQVIYDPLWYSANVMSAVWAFLFLLSVAAAFYSSYAFYLGNKKAPGQDGPLNIFWAVTGIMSLLLAGLIIHMLSMESLHPELWRFWLTKGWQHFLTGGTEFHQVAPGRLAHFLLASFAVTGVFLMLYAWYFEPRSDYSADYIKYVSETGAKLALYGTILAWGAGFWWAGEISPSINFFRNPVFLLSLAAALAFVLYLAGAVLHPVKYAVPASITLFLTIFLMCGSREALRAGYMEAFSYHINDYKLNLDFGSTLLFFSSLLAGVVVLCFPALAAFKAGRAEPDTVVKIAPAAGKLANAVLILWFLVVAGLGLVISFRNGVLF